MACSKASRSFSSRYSIVSVGIGKPPKEPQFLGRHCYQLPVPKSRAAPVRWLGGWVVGWLGGWVVRWLGGLEHSAQPPNHPTTQRRQPRLTAAANSATYASSRC